MNRSLLALVTLLSSLSLSGCFDGTPDRTEQYDFRESIERVEILTGAGDIEVQGDPSAVEATVRARVYGEKTEVIANLEGGTLDLRHRCPKRYRQCSVEWIVVLPQAETPRIFEASSGAGDIDFFDLDGIFVVETGAGDIGLHDVTSTDIDLESGSGDIGARVTGALESVRVETGAGDVTLRIPSGAYQVDIETGAGDVSKQGIVDDPAAAHVIEIETGAGDVELRGS